MEDAQPPSVASPPSDDALPPPPPPPPPSVVGYGRLTTPTGATARAPASILSPTPAPQVLTDNHLPSTLPATYGAPAAGAFERNAFLTLAQILAGVQGALTLIGGVYALLGQVPFESGFSTTAVPGALAGELFLDGLFVIVIGVALIVAAWRVSNPSAGARWSLIAWELLAFVFVLAVQQHWDVLATFRDASLVLAFSNGFAIANGLPALILAAVVVYGLLIHRPTRRAFDD